MDKVKGVKKAKMYLKMLSEGVHPLTSEDISKESIFLDEKIKNCFGFVIEILDEFLELSEKVEQLEKEREENSIVVLQKQKFFITQEQCEAIEVSKEPITMFSFLRNINSVNNSDSMEKLSSTRINKWLTIKDLYTQSKVQETVYRTKYKPSEKALKIGITEEEYIDKKSGDVKYRIKLDSNAQMFIIENIHEILATT